MSKKNIHSTQAMKCFANIRGTNPKTMQGAIFPTVLRALDCFDYYGRGKVYEVEVRIIREIKPSSPEWKQWEAMP